MITRPPLPRLFLSTFLVSAVSAAAPAQLPEDPGPHLVGHSNTSFQDQFYGRGFVQGRIYYPATAAGQDTPADPGSGPYPLIGFQHGWLGSPNNYDHLCTHIASWGFVVASIGTETGIFGQMQSEAADTQALMEWVVYESGNPMSWLGRMIKSGPWGAAGHSMGGGALMYLIELEPRIEVIVPLQPYNDSGLGGSAQGRQNLAQWEGSAHFIAGQLDTTVPPSTQVYPYFQLADLARRNVYTQVQGMGHGGPTDNPPNNEPLSASEQSRVHRRLVAGVFRAELKGEEDLYLQILGEGADNQPFLQQSDVAETMLWVGDSNTAGNLAVGAASRPGNTIAMAWSLTPGSVATQYGELGLDPGAMTVFFQANAGPPGFAEELLPVAPLWSGLNLYLQAVGADRSGGLLSRTAVVQIP